MNTTARKYGRRPPKNAPALMLGPLLTGTVPTHDQADDWLARLGGGWNMLGNDRAGDCVSVTFANERRVATGGKSYPSQAEVWKFYQTQNPNFDPNGSPSTDGPGSSADGGMDIQTALEYLAAHGGPDGVKLVAFAKVDHTNLDEVKAAIAIFGSVWTGITVQNHNQSEFPDSPWTWDPSDQIDGGHSIITGGYGPAGAGTLGGDERFITWAEETSFTDGFWKSGVEEAWVAVWPETLQSDEFQQGVDQAALATAYQELTGKTLPVPAPTPTPSPTPGPTPPAPTPTPTPAPDFPSILRRLIAYLERVLKEIGG